MSKNWQRKVSLEGYQQANNKARMHIALCELMKSYGVPYVQQKRVITGICDANFEPFRKTFRLT